MSIADLIPISLPDYHEKYRVGGYSRLGKLCYAKILRRTEVSEVSWPIEVNGAGASPVTISTSYADKDFFSPVSGSSCKISMVAESYGQLLELGRGDDTMWKVEVVDDGDTIFRGFLKPETFQMEYGYEKPVVNMDATDGFGILRKLEFLSETTMCDVIGDFTLSDIVSYLLWRAGNTSNWRDYVNYAFSQQASDNLLRHLKRNVFSWKEKDCYAVLTELLSIFNMQIVSRKGIVCVRLIDDPGGTDQHHYDEYTYRGEYAGDGLNEHDPIDIYTEYEGASGSVRMQPAMRKLNISADMNPVENLIHNGDFRYGNECWSVFWGFPNTHWRVDEDARAIILRGWHPFNPSGVQLDTGVKIKFTRSGSFSTPVTVTFEVRKIRPQPDKEYTIKFSINTQGAVVFNPFVWVQSDDAFDTSWHRGSVTIHPLSSISGDVALHIHTTPSIDNMGVMIKNIVVRPAVKVEDEYNYVEIDENDSEHEFKDLGIDEVSETIHFPFGGSSYVYDNVFPNIPGKWFPKVTNRATGIISRPHAFIKERCKTYYRQARIRLTVELHRKEESESITPFSMLFDKYLERIFVIASSQYDMLRGKYSLEIIEHIKASLPPLTWILADGFWNDDGYWVDAKQWNDTDPT